MFTNNLFYAKCTVREHFLLFLNFYAWSPLQMGTDLLAGFYHWHSIPPASKKSSVRSSPSCRQKSSKENGALVRHSIRRVCLKFYWCENRISFCFSERKFEFTFLVFLMSVYIWWLRKTAQIILHMQETNWK